MTNQPPSSALQLDLVREIVRMIQDGSIAVGSALREARLAEEFGVSRTPIRAALNHLKTLDIVEKKAKRGFFVKDNPEQIQAVLSELPQARHDALKDQIAKDWFTGRLSQDISETELRKHYGLGRATAQRILSELSESGIVTRAPGYGWQFTPTINSRAAHQQSFDFRIAIEPAGILSEEFEYNDHRGRVLVQQHTQLLREPTDKIQPKILVDLDIEFHQFIAECSNNRFFIAAIEQQNRLRKLLEYNALVPTGRLFESNNEHLEILYAFESNNLQRAANLLRAHLKRAKRAGKDLFKE